MKRHVSVRCWLFGHHDVVRRAPNRLYLECFDCGRQTRGWTIGGADRPVNSARAQRPSAVVGRHVSVH